jgi:nitroreductase
MCHVNYNVKYQSTGYTYRSKGGNKMDCFQAIKTRRSIRSFLSEPIPEEDLLKIMDAGRMAPSAGNLQPCYFIAVTESQQIQLLKDAAFGQEHIGQAPCVIVVCVDPERSAKYGDTGRNYLCLLDAANATQNMLLAATALGYGSCWVAGFSEKRVKKLLGLPEGFRVVSLIPIGKAAAEQEMPPRRPLEDVILWQKWHE